MKCYALGILLLLGCNPTAPYKPIPRNVGTVARLMDSVETFVLLEQILGATPNYITLR